MAESPDLAADGVLRYTVTANGELLPPDVQLISASITRAVNSVPMAKLVFMDGDVATQTFPIADMELLVPGVELVVNLGYGDSSSEVFKGVVVRFGVKVSGDNESRLLVECRDKAAAMTLGRVSANYIDKTDSAIISGLIGQYAGLTTDVSSTTVSHKELVQHDCCDWDFMMARAEANGHLVTVTGGAVKVAPPNTAAAPALVVSYGIDLIEFNAEMYARTQLSSVKTVAWSPATQAIVEATATPPDALPQGDLKAAALAQTLNLASFRMQTHTPLANDALTVWAKARQTKADLARVRGRVKFQGSALAVPGGMLELKGVGTRFNGNAFISSVVHDVREGNWTTEAELGLAPQWFTERSDVVSPNASGWVPGVRGLQIGVVMKLDADPEAAQRIQVKVPVLGVTTDGVWARLAKFHASNTFGAFFIPEVGDEVLLGYLNDDPSHPVILGSLYSAKHPPAYALEAANNIKAIVTRCKSKIEFNDEDKVITITTPANNQLVFSDKDKSIVMSDQNGNKVELNPSGITISSPKDITIDAKGKVAITAVAEISATAQADVKLSGLNISAAANIALSAKGTASAELSAAGTTTVKGAMVMIN